MLISPLLEGIWVLNWNWGLFINVGRGSYLTSFGSKHQESDHMFFLFANEDHKDKIWCNSFKRRRRQCILSEDYSITTNFPCRLLKVLLGILIMTTFPDRDCLLNYCNVPCKVCRQLRLGRGLTQKARSHETNWDLHFITDYHHQPFVLLFTENNKKSIQLSVMKETCRASAFNLGVTTLKNRDNNKTRSLWYQSNQLSGKPCSQVLMTEMNFTIIMELIWIIK